MTMVPAHTLKSRNWILVMTWMTPVGFFGLQVQTNPVFLRVRLVENV